MELGFAGIAMGVLQMNTPKFKPTKWDVYSCKTCSHTYNESAPRNYCINDKHQILKRPNNPFFMKEMQIDGVWYKGWWHVKGPAGESFVISPQNTALIIKGCGIAPGGFIRNQWWMFCKIGSAMSLKWIPSDEEDVSK